jgi:N-methylhydantoinase A
MNVDEAAFSMLRIINNNMSNGIRYVSVAEGHDPRDFALMSFGGAGSITACTQARDLGISKVLVPRTASVFCALGELLADLRISQLHPVAGRLAEIDAEALTTALGGLAEGARGSIQALPGVESTNIERYAEMRYVGQVHELATPMPVQANGKSKAALEETASRFHELHRQRYAFAMPEKPVEILAVRQDVVGKRGWEIPVYPVKGGADASGAIKAHRRVCFATEDASGFRWIDTPIYDAAKLEPGHEFQGPAVIEAVDTTIVVQPGDRCSLNKYQVFEIVIDGGIDEARH